MKIPALFLKTFAILLLGGSVLAQDIPAQKYRLNLPPPAELHYAIKLQQKGFAFDGEAIVRWATSAGQFSVAGETRAQLVGKVLDTRSEGGIDDYGLAPNTFSEKRFRKEAATATFDRAAKTISFATTDAHYDIKGGEQDRSSVIWQLAAIARAAPAKFKSGTEWHFFVIGPRDADAWTFSVGNQEKVETPLGLVNTVHITRSPPPGSQEQKLDIWLAPSMEWYPVRLRFSEQGDDFIEQTLTKIVKTP